MFMSVIVYVSVYAPVGLITMFITLVFALYNGFNIYLLNAMKRETIKNGKIEMLAKCKWIKIKIILKAIKDI